MKKQAILVSLIVFCSLFTSNKAFSAAFQIKEQSAKGQGVAFAGMAAGDKEDPSYMFYNPASVSLIKGTTAQTNGAVILAFTKAREVHAQDKNNTVIAGKDRESNLLGTFFIPSAYIASELNESLSAGLTINAPFALSTDYNENWVGRYHGIYSEIQTYNISPTMGYRPFNWLAIGGGPTFQYFEANLTNAINFNQGLPGTPDGIGDMTGNDWAIGWTGGFIFTPYKGVRLGASYRSKHKYDIDGKVKYKNISAPFNAAPYNYVDQKAKTNITTPSSYNIGARWDINDKWAVLAEADYTRWSSFYKLDIDFELMSANSLTIYNWKDTWFGALGLEYKFNDKITLRGGIAMDQTPIKSAEYRTPRVADGDRKWFSTGLNYKYSDNLSFDFSFTYIKVDTTLSNLSRNDEGNLNRGDLTAKYSGHIDILTAGLKYNF